MTERRDVVTILIEPASGGGYSAQAPGLDGTVHGATMAEAFRIACERLGRSPTDSVHAKVQENTPVAATELVSLLETIGHADRLNLSKCDLSRIDLSPHTLDALSTPEVLRIPQTKGLRLTRINLQGADLSRAQLQGIVLIGAQLQDASLRDANLEAANLRGAQLQRCDLERASLDGVDLSRASLERAILLKANLGNAQLIDTNLQRADLTEAQLNSANLLRAQLQNILAPNTKFQGAFLRDAQLQDAYLASSEFQRAFLQGCQMQGAHLRDAHLQETDLRDVDCREIDLRVVASLDRVCWHNAKLEKTWLYRYQIEPVGDELHAHATRRPEDYRAAMEAYLVLKVNFQSLGNYADASWAYVKEQQMEKMAHFWEWRARGWAPWRNWRAFLRWLRNWAYELLTGYGERPQMPVIWGLLTIVLFAIVFALAGNVATGDPGIGTPPTHDFLTALTHSIAAFATVGFNTLEPVGWGARLLTAAESMLGIGFFALLIYTIGNRMSRS